MTAYRYADDPSWKQKRPRTPIVGLDVPCRCGAYHIYTDHNGQPASCGHCCRVEKHRRTTK